MIIKTPPYIFIFIFLFAVPGFSQTSRGDKYYEQSEYFKAIPFYKKDTRSKSSQKKQEALIKLGNSYKYINDYTNSEECFRKALEINSDVAPEVFYNYAQVLKVNTKYELAAEQYANYIRLSPNDPIAK